MPAKWVIRKIAERLSNSSIPDLNSGLRAFRRSVSLPYLRLLPPGFSCVTTITLAFLSNQHDIKYVPIDYAKRSGTSKFHFVKDAYRYILQVLRMVMYFNPLKVLMPLALWLLGIGLAKGVYDLFAHFGRFAVNTVLIFITGMLIARAGAARGPHRPLPLGGLDPTWLPGPDARRGRRGPARDRRSVAGAGRALSGGRSSLVAVAAFAVGARRTVVARSPTGLRDQRPLVLAGSLGPRAGAACT